MVEESAPRFEERRLYARYVCTSGSVCELSLRSGIHIFEVLDISGGGMRIRTRDRSVLEEFPEDAAVRIVSGGRATQTSRLDDLTGRVVWTRAERSGVLVGIEFHTPLASRLDYLLGLLFDSGQLPAS